MQMPTPEQVDRFLSEMVLFTVSMKSDPPLTETQWQMIRLRLYDLIFEVESRRPL
jgi:hypothetical protein